MTNHQPPQTFDPDAEPSSPLSEAVGKRDRETIAMVSRAVAKGKVMLAFQPVMQAAAPLSAAYYEAFLRVLDDRGRIIPAADFITVVEGQELGRQLDMRALELGFEALAEEPSLRLAINMSARSIGYPKWMAVLRRGLERDSTAGERLILEITERSAIAMPDLVQVFMQEMVAKGVTFSLDDFGLGYSSFRYLRDFYFDILKIDGEFTRNIASSPDNQVIAQAMISVARQLDMIAVGTNVETSEDAEALIEAGCDLLQGHVFSVPTTRPWWREGNESRKRA